MSTLSKLKIKCWLLDGLFKMRNNRILIFVLVLSFLYCWIKFYAFYSGVAHGPFGSSEKGDFFFYVELICHFLPIALFITSAYLSISVSKNKEQNNSQRLLLALVLFIVAAGSGVFSVEEYAAGNSFTYLKYYYEDWRFFSDNFLMENLMLFFVSGFLFLFKVLSRLLKRA